ncbi:hypothetical protein ANN_15507 [Periplaneta americana]|uniref:Reverse transcriptase n=1 Tax=Periplaneta americana TaxID=6978 RepID=A0ABQ8SGU0_PERAM|nr:hypothetical protein ANN_15507 [Periplaneta americana]
METAATSARLMAPVRHRWSINDVIGGIRNTVVPSDCSPKKNLKIDAHCNKKGKGVILNIEIPSANSWIRNYKGLILSEWIDALKIVRYVAPIRAVPGRSREGIRCRRCLREIETLPHILGFCPYSEALCNIRHHAVRSMLAEELKEVEFVVNQEVQGLATQGSVRRIHIIAIKNNSAYILEPTVRFETHADQPHEVGSEKKRIYEPTIPFYKDKYSLSHIDVIGLMVGARALYGAETWILRRSEEKRIEHLKCDMEKDETCEMDRQNKKRNCVGKNG